MIACLPNTCIFFLYTAPGSVALWRFNTDGQVSTATATLIPLLKRTGGENMTEKKLMG